MFHNNVFFLYDLGGLGISDHTHTVHSDFHLEFLEVIFIAARRDCAIYGVKWEGQLAIRHNSRNIRPLTTLSPTFPMFFDALRPFLISKLMYLIHLIP